LRLSKRNVIPIQLKIEETINIDWRHSVADGSIGEDDSLEERELFVKPEQNIPLT